MINTVSHLLNEPAKPGDVGIEIEVEGKKPLPFVAEGPWRCKADGSLRYNGMEYVTKSPIRVCNNKIKKIELLTNKLEKKEFEVIHNSPRSSVHVHVNVMRHTPTEVWNFVTAYWLLENLLMKYCGEDYREGNLFCLRLKDAEDLLTVAKDSFKRDIPFDLFKELGGQGNRIRYSSMNLAALPKFGSVEFRGMRGTIDPIIIDEWSTELFNLSENIKKFSDPGHLMDVYYGLQNKEDFLKMLFSNNFVNKIKTFSKDWTDLIEDNEDLLCEIAYNHDWDEWGKRADKAIEDRKKPKENLQEKPKENLQVLVRGINLGQVNIVDHMDDLVRIVDDVDWDQPVNIPER